jgi:predicted phosphodiesterase
MHGHPIMQKPRPASGTQALPVSDTHGRVHPDILSLARQVDIVIHAGDARKRSTTK